MTVWPWYMLQTSTLLSLPCMVPFFPFSKTLCYWTAKHWVLKASKAISGPFRKINFITHDLLPSGLVAQLAWEQGCRSGESTRLPPMWRGFESWCQPYMWVEFVVGSLPCSETFFSRYSGFPLSLKTNTSKFLIDLEHTDMFQRVLNWTRQCSVGKKITLITIMIVLIRSGS